MAIRNLQLLWNNMEQYFCRMYLDRENGGDVYAAIFLHFGLAHLANNMDLYLFWTGDRLERLIGKWRYLIIYFGAGLWR